MSKIYTNRTRIVVRFISFLAALLYVAPGFAQTQAPLTTCNTFISLSSVPSNSVAATVVTGSGNTWTGATPILASLTDEGFVVDNNPDNYAVLAPLALGGTARITVQNSGGYYAAGTYAAFDIAPNSGLLSLDLLGMVTIKTYMGDTLKETKTVNSSLAGVTLLNAGSGRQRLGFKTTQNFNRVMIEQTAVLSLFGSLRVYGAVIERYCAGPAPTCNANVALTAPIYPVFTEAGTTALVAVNSTITNPNFVIDSDPSNYATVAQTVGVAANAEFEVADAVTSYTNTFAGFDIENPNLLDLGLLSNITVSAYNNETFVGSATGNNLLALNTGLLAGSGRQVVGFVPNGAFNSVRITFNQTVSVTLGTTRIYGMILKQFCTNDITCAQPIGLKNTANPAYPVFVNARRTGITGTGCVACAVNNTNNLIDGNSNTFATIDLTAGVLSTGSIAVKNQLQDYPAGSYAGFEIESATLLAADIVGNIKFKLYRNDTLVQDGTGQPLLAGVGTDILTGGTSPKQIVGIISNVAFDEVVMEVNNLIAANVLGTINVYETYIETSCARNVPCMTSEVLSQTQHGAVVNGANTGVSGAVCAGCKVDDPWNAVSASNADFSRLYNTVNALSTTSLGVAVPQYVYPAGTFAGFVIKRNNFAIAASLFPNITISTYNNGVLQETNSGSNLLNLSVLVNLIGSDTNVYNAGFVATLPFDEVKISMNTIVTALDQYIDVYGAFVDTRFIPAGTAGMACNITNPDINVGYINKPIPGNVKTNDIVTPTTTYSTATAIAGNPAASLPVVNADGTYTFTTTVPGVYQFLIPVCDNAICTNQRLTITVKDPAVRNSVPVVNMDIASVKMNQSVVIPSLANDYAGTGGTALVPASVTLTDLNGGVAGNTSNGGTAVVNTTNGQITYTPATGFIGSDTIRYTVCDNQVPAQCGSAFQIVTVLPATYANSTLAADDHIQTYRNKAVSGNVKTNDIDPEEHTQTVTAQNVTIPGQGTFVLATNGAFTFTPVTGFLGTAQLSYNTCDNGTPSTCAQATVYVLVTPEPQTLPDFNAGLVNAPIPGNASTNDIVPVGTTYGSATLVASPVASAPVLNVNADGTYTFQANLPGVYRYDIQVCLADQVAPCPAQRLSITVIDNTVNSNTPAVHDDVVTTPNNTAITYNVRLNDAASNDGNTLGVPSIILQPAHGTAVVNANGTITYTPTSGYSGTDTLTYQACEVPSTQCGTARMIVTVLPADAYNTISPVDDYVRTPKNVTASGNVLTNDVDAEGNTLTVAAQNLTLPGQGTFVLNTNGTFTFAPVSGFLGSVDLPYTATDNGTPVLSGKATLHIVVKEGTPDLTLSTAIGAGTFFPASTTSTRYVVIVSEVSGYATRSSVNPVYVRVFKLPGLTYAFDPLATTVGGATVDNPNWEIFSESSSNMVLKLKSGIDINGYNLSRIGLMLQVQSTATNGVKVQNTVIINGSGTDNNNANNTTFRNLNVQ